MENNDVVGKGRCYSHIVGEVGQFIFGYFVKKRRSENEE
jgi:hypothetical protein